MQTLGRYGLCFAWFAGCALAGCASLARNDKTEQLTIAETSEIDYTPIAFDQLTGLASYKFQAAANKVEWIACKGRSGKKAAGVILVMHRDRAGFEDKKFCEGWIAQTFLSQSLDVVTINRPGYGESTGVVDFSGKQSMAALDAGLAAALAKAGLAGIDGIWGYSTGAAAAALFSKHHPAARFLILGGGIYDYEQTLKETTDDYIRKDIEAIKATGGDVAIEDRSVGYDVTGLPAQISIYHAKQDKSAPLSQAKAFVDALSSSGGYRVSYQVIEGVAHEMPWTHHRKILEVLAHSLTQPE